MYAAATHSSAEVLIDRSAWMEGAATLTIVESRMLRIIAERITEKPAHIGGGAARSESDFDVVTTGGSRRVVMPSG